MRIRFTQPEVQNILSLYNSGKNQVEIADLYGTFNTSIRRVLVRNGITPRTSIEVRSSIEAIPYSNDSLTREECYFLGMLAADGCISAGRLTLGLKESDVYMLERFAKFLDPKIKVNRYFHKAHDIYQYEVKVRNVVLVDRLTNLVNFKNKSFDCEMYVPINWDIFRGIMDGNGTISNTNALCNVIISGASTKLLHQLQSFLESCGVTAYVGHARENVYILRVHKQADIKVVFENMYRDTDLYLTRKKEKYGPLLERYPELKKI